MTYLVVLVAQAVLEGLSALVFLKANFKIRNLIPSTHFITKVAVSLSKEQKGRSLDSAKIMSFLTLQMRFHFEFMHHARHTR